MASRQALQDRLGRPLLFVLRLKITGQNDPKGQLLTALRETGVRISDVELVEIETTGGDLIYELTLLTSDDDQLAAARQAAEGFDGVEVIEVIDPAMESHRGGACWIESAPIESNTELRIVYTPGVARVCKAIEADPELAREYTGIHNTVAIVTNGTAILGLGDIGCVPGMPVMEGKAAIFRNFADLSAAPVLVDTHDIEKFVETVCMIAPTYGAIQVEDVKAPECFAITRQLDERLDIPVMHDDQHGTATICLAGLNSALKQTGRNISDMRCVISGAGASGTGITDLLLEAGIGDVILADSKGLVSRGRDGLNDEKQKLAERTNKDNLSGTLADAMKGADVFIGCSQPNIVSAEMVRSMHENPILFPLANPVSEISRDEAESAGATIYADGRYMNNAIAYPGIFRGAMDGRARKITFAMMMAAADALAEIVPDGELLPEMMDPATHAAVADAVAGAVE